MIYIGNNTIWICDFKGKMKFTIAQKNNIKIEVVENKCDNQGIPKMLSESVFFLIQENQDMSTYDKQLN